MTDYSKFSLEMLKVKAQELGIKGRSKMNKAELVSAVTEAVNSKAEEKPSMVEMIKARLREAKEWRSNAGRKAGSEAAVSGKMSKSRKAAVYSAQRNGGRLTARQLRRLRKTYA